MRGAIVLLAVFLTACAADPLRVSTEPLQNPPLNEVTSVELGQVVAESGVVSYRDALVLKNPLTWHNILGQEVTIKPGVLIGLRGNDDYEFYYSGEMSVGEGANEIRLAGGICVKKTDETYVRAFAGDGALCNFSITGSIDVQKTRVAGLGANGFRRELVYGGRVGDDLHFLYRQISNDPARPPLSLQIALNVSEGNVLAVGGGAIEVIEATNARITYRVVRAFQNDAPMLVPPPAQQAKPKDNSV